MMNPIGINRRTFFDRVGDGLYGAALASLLTRDLYGTEPHHKAALPTDTKPRQPHFAPRAKSVIFLFLFGGPSQLETFDMKPDAPSAIRGPFRTTPSKTPELRISEHLSRTAAISDKLAIIKTMTHSYNDHSGAGHYIQTGHRWNIPIGGGFNVTPNDAPSMGSIVKYYSQHQPGGLERQMPSYVVVPNFLGRLQDYKVQLRRPGETAGWLGRGYDPLNTRLDKRDKDDNPYFRDCTDEELDYRIQGLEQLNGITLDRLDRRNSLLTQFNKQRRLLDKKGNITAMDRFRQRALALVSSEQTQQAFDVRREPDKLRDRYGRHLFGQSTLVARRLVETGVRFVTVHYDAVDGYSWDSHRSSDYLEKHLVPTLDQALSALLTDLDERGMLDRVNGNLADSHRKCVGGLGEGAGGVGQDHDGACRGCRGMDEMSSCERH